MIDFDYRQSLLQRINEILAKYGSKGSHFEMASMYDESFLRLINSNVLREITSVGCNEQEIQILYSFLMNGTTDAVYESQMSMDEIIHKMMFVMQSLRPYKLTRIHMHTLAYQVRNTSTAVCKLLTRF